MLKAPATGTSYTTSLLGGTNGSNLPNITYDCPQYVAEDGAGNIYVGDYGCNPPTYTPAVYQLALQANGSYVKNTLGSGWVEPMGVAVDSVGNVYATDIGTGNVSKLTLSNGSYTQSTIASGIASVNDLTVDASGNVYVVSDGGTVNGVVYNPAVIKLTLSGSSYTKSTLGGGWVSPNQISIDGNRNLYVSDYYAQPNTVFKLTLQTDGSYTESAIISHSQLTNPVGVAVDGAGNPFIVDNTTVNVYKLDIIDGPTIIFPTATAHGSTDTTDGTLTTTVQNIGNQPLTFTSIAVASKQSGTNYVLDSGKTTCSTSKSLAVNATCVVGVYFTPSLAGTLTGTVTLTDNSTTTTQIINLSGSGSVLPPAPTINSKPVLRTTATTATFTFSDTQSGVTYLCSLDSATPSACVSGISYASLALTTHSYSVEAVDASNNISAPATYSWTVINPPPSPTLILDPPSTTTSTTATFNFLDGLSGETNHCSLDGVAYAACGATDGNPNGTIIYSSLVLGAHNFAVEAIDDYNNISAPTTYSWTIVAPSITVTVGTNPEGLSFTVDGTSYTDTAYLYWTVGSTHTIATTSSQTPTDIQATFVSWSDGGAISHAVTAPSVATTYTATFNASYLLTTAANPSGSGTVLPASGTYYPSGTVVNLTATPASGYTFGNWSGSLTGVTSNATTVTMNAPESVTANFYISTTLLPEWTWEAGSSTGNQTGAYLTESAFSATNYPGGRTPAASGTDSNGNLWIFGGKGYDSAGTLGYLNDLWIFKPSSGWEWVSGGKTVNAYGVTSGTGNTPGARQNSIGWTDSNGNLWLYGGYGYDVAGTKGILHDLWEYNSAKGWVLVSGYGSVGTTTGADGQLGTYGTLGTYDPLNLPGSREYAIGWADGSGNIWLFGGEGDDSKGTLGRLNDLWEFSPSQGAAGEWRWMGGSNLASSVASYGNLNTPGSTYIPGGRLSSLGWTDKSGNFWLFGGEGYDSTGVFGELNDLWEYVPPTGSGTGVWTWVSGSKTITASGVYGALGTPTATNRPGSRLDATGWTDGSGNLWLLGGLGLDVNGNNSPYGYPLSDLWEFNTSTSQWTWMGGGNTVDDPGVYGALEVAAYGNMPGSRYFATSWTDKSGKSWLFGGYGLDGSGNFGYLNDVWTYSLAAAPTAPPTPTIEVNSEPANPTTATSAAFTFTDAQSGVTYQCSLDNSAYSTCVSGSSYGPLAAGPHTFSVEALTGAGISSPATYNWAINAATVQVTVGTTPAGVSFTVDNTSYTSAQTLTWTVGSSHTIAVTSPQTSGGTQNAFASWSDGGATSHSITASAGTTSYMATFSTAYQLTTAAAPTGGGSVLPATGSYYPSGTVVNLTVTPNTSYVFSNWTGNVASASAASTTVTMNAPQSVTANFTATEQVTVGTTPAGLSFSVDNTSYTSAQTLTWIVGSSHTIAVTSPQTSGGTQNTFTSWSDGGAASHSVTVSAGTTSYTATFSTAYQLTTAATPTGGGSVLPATGSYYPSGTVVDLTATPNTSYVFSNWTGNVASASAASTTITMSAPESVTVNFTAVVTPPVTATFVLGSTNATQTVLPGGTATYTINITSQNGSYTDPVTLSVLAGTLPAGATASFSTNPVTPGAAGASSTLTIHTVATTGNKTPAGSPWPLAGPALALIGIFFLPGKRQRRWLALGVLLFASLGALTALSGCGGGFAMPGPISSNNVTVVGTSAGGSNVQTTIVKLVIQ